MGIIGANEDDDDYGAVGVAFGSTITGYRIGFAGADFLPNIISGLQQVVTDDIDVMNMSIGLVDAFVHSANTDTVATEVTNVVNNGRGGLGGILVKSAGNDRSQNFDTNGEVLASKRGVITVASVDRDGDVSSFSTHGASILVSAFGQSNSVVTTDRTGTDGYNWCGLAGRRSHVHL